AGDSSTAAAPRPAKVDYNFQIRPLLADRCFACHGPDEKKRKAHLRLDDPKVAFGRGVLVPGQPEESPLIDRITADDDERMPPAPADVDAFLADTSPRAFARVADRLLASPRFGERMALDWLDAARYADSFGYQADGDSHLWPWRDWVIRAFNANLPYDQFVT